MPTFDEQKFIAELLAQMSKITKIPAEKISMNADLSADLGLDSLSSMELITHISEKWGVDVDFEDATGFTTVQDIIDYAREIIEE